MLDLGTALEVLGRLSLAVNHAITVACRLDSKSPLASVGRKGEVERAIGVRAQRLVAHHNEVPIVFVLNEHRHAARVGRSHVIPHHLEWSEGIRFAPVFDDEPFVSQSTQPAPMTCLGSQQRKGIERSGRRDMCPGVKDLDLLAGLEAIGRPTIVGRAIELAADIWVVQVKLRVGTKGFAVDDDRGVPSLCPIAASESAP
ncbi:MAG: hypothetical protein KY475_16995 [Planctomycetes bacterium]|nr:hypothetical protein [Planctomycetota bacterium]